MGVYFLKLRVGIGHNVASPIMTIRSLLIFWDGGDKDIFWQFLEYVCMQIVCIVAANMVS